MAPIYGQSAQSNAIAPLTALVGITDRGLRTQIVPDRRSLSITFHNRGRNIKFRIPTQPNHNQLGLLAENDNGEFYLCRQRFTNRDRVLADENERFIAEQTDLRYASFSHGGRVYHAVICLSRGETRILEDLSMLFSHL